MVASTVLFVHAHPDDESLWTGGTIARLVDAGSHVSVVTCTWADGTKRHGELQRAMAILGAGPATALGYADGGFPESAPAADALCDCHFDDAVRAVAAQIRAIRPDAVVTYDACGIYGHPDHVHTHRLTLAAIEAAACGFLYPDTGPPWQTASTYFVTVPLSVMSRLGMHIIGQPPGSPSPQKSEGDTTIPGTPDDEIDVVVDVDAWVDRKWAAINEHRSELDRSVALRLLLGLDESRRTALLRTESYLRRDLVPDGVDLV